MSANSASGAFTASHRLYVKSLYKRYLTNSLNWYIRRDLWRQDALAIRAAFDANQNVTDPRALAAIFEKAEARLKDHQHPDPYVPPLFPGGTKYDRNAHPPIYSAAEMDEIYANSPK